MSHPSSSDLVAACQAALTYITALQGRAELGALSVADCAALREGMREANGRLYVAVFAYENWLRRSGIFELNVAALPPLPSWAGAPATAPSSAP